LLTLDAAAGLRLHNSQGVTEPLGQIGPVTASYVCLRTYEGLVAVDPVDGAVLWTKTDVSPHTQIFGDDEYVYLIDVRDNKAIGSGRAVRGRDGAAVDVPDFASQFQQRQRIVDGRLLVFDKNASTPVLHLYDIRSGKDLWKKDVAPEAILLGSEDSELTGLVEPDGKLTLVDLLVPAEVLQAHVRPADMDKVNAGLLLQDAKNYYVILNRSEEQKPDLQGPYPNVASLRWTPINGTIYSFYRPTGKLHWYKPMPNQILLLERFQDLPMLLFTARFNKQVNGGPYVTQVVANQSIDKTTGKLLQPAREQSDYPAHARAFHALAIDRRAGTYDLVAQNMKLRHYLAEPRSKTISANNISERNGGSMPDGILRLFPEKLRSVPLRDH
jgi:hypothetical protein